MKPLRIAVTGGRGRLAPAVAAHLRQGDAEVVSFSRLAGGNFQETSLLTEPRTLSAFDAVLHLGWSTLPLTSEEEPGSEQATDLPLLQGHFGGLCSRPAPAASGFLFVGGSLRKHDRFRHRRNALPPRREICPRQADGGRGHSHSVHPSSRPAVRHLAGIKCLRSDREFDKTARSHSSHLPRDS